MNPAYVPITVYLVSAVLLYVQTCMITSALDHIRHRPHRLQQTICVYCLLAPILVTPIVPIVLLLNLDSAGQAQSSTLVYAGALWAAGLFAALPAYWYATRPVRSHALA